MKVNVISSQLDGGELRREQQKNRWHTKAEGKHDEQLIEYVSQKKSAIALSPGGFSIDSALKLDGHDFSGSKRQHGIYVTMPSGAWERIFGSKK